MPELAPKNLHYIDPVRNSKTNESRRSVPFDSRLPIWYPATFVTDAETWFVASDASPTMRAGRAAGPPFSYGHNAVGVRRRDAGAVRP